MGTNCGRTRNLANFLHAFYCRPSDSRAHGFRLERLNYCRITAERANLIWVTINRRKVWHVQKFRQLSSRNFALLMHISKLILTIFLTSSSKVLHENLYSQLREEELRARRALRVLRHQEGQIRRLERLCQSGQCNSHASQHVQDPERCKKMCEAGLNEVDLTGRKRAADVEQIQVGCLWFNKIKNWNNCENLQSFVCLQREMEQTRKVLLRSKG